MSIFKKNETVAEKDRVISDLRKQLTAYVREDGQHEVAVQKLQNQINLLEVTIMELTVQAERDVKTVNELRAEIRNLNQIVEDNRNESIVAVREATEHLEEELKSQQAKYEKVRNENASLEAKLESLDKIVDLAPDVQDIKELVSKIIDKLPTININGMSQSVNTGSGIAQTK